MFFTSLDPVPAWKAWWRRFATLRKVTRRVAPAISQQDFEVRLLALQKKALQSPEIAIKASMLWEIEHLSENFFKGAELAGTLKSPGLPVELLPLAHVGAGIGAVEAGRFQPRAIQEQIESLSHPEFRLFCFESVGAMLGVCKRDIFSLGFLLGLPIPLKLPPPERTSFLGSFPTPIRRVISHGFGRVLYFKRFNVATAVRAALRLPEFQISSLIQGIAFAFTFVNHRDLDRVLQVAGRFGDRQVRQAFLNGQIYLLEFWEWHLPGLLDWLRPQVAHGSHILEAAAKQVEVNRALGRLRAFEVQ